MNEKHNIEHVLSVFDDYLKRADGVEFYWSEKKNTFFCVQWEADEPIAQMVRTGQEACETILHEIYMDKYLEFGFHRVRGTARMNEEQWVETLAIMQPYLIQLPDYLNSVLSVLR